MARCEVIFPTELIEKLDSLQQRGEDIALKALDEAAPIYEDALKRELQKHDKTGQLSKSIKRTKPKKFKGSIGAYYTVIRPTGKSNSTKPYSHIGAYERKEPYRNMEKLADLELGVRGRQPATPIMTRVTNSCQSQVFEKMDEVITKEIEAT